MSKISLPVVVTPSRIELGLRCYRRHVLSDILQRATYYSPSLEFGSVIHAGVAAHWKGDSVAKTLNDEWYKRFECNPQVSTKDVSLPLALAMLERYAQNAHMAGPFALETGSWELVTVEERFEIPLTLPDDDKAKLSFQIDRLVYNKQTGHLVVVDTKTAGRMDRRWERQWETSLQMKLYKASIAKAYDAEPEDVDVVIEGVLKNIPSEIRYVSCPDWSPALLNEALMQARHVASSDLAVIRHPDYHLPRDKDNVEEHALTKTTVNYMSCFEYGVECPFRRLCVAEPDERVAILHAEYFETNTEEY